MRGLIRDAIIVAGATGIALALGSAASACSSQSGPPPGTISTIAGGVGGPGRATAIGLYRPCGLALAAGRSVIGQSTMVRMVDPATDRLTTLAGVGLERQFGDGLFSPDGTPAIAAELDGACGVAVDSGGVALTAANSGQVQFVPARTGTFFGRPMTGGATYVVAGDGKALNLFVVSTADRLGDGGPATKAELGSPAGLTLDSSGNLVIADAALSRIRVVAATSGTFYGKAMTAGDIYTIAGTGFHGFTGDGGPATAARIYEPAAVAFDASGNLLLASGPRVRVIAASTGTFYGQAMTAGDIYTIAGHGVANPLGDGGPALAAGLLPVGIATDQAGNVVIADGFHHRVRVIAAVTGTFYGQAMTAGDIHTIAGDGERGFSGDGGPGTMARLSTPQAVHVDAAGNVLIADALNNRIRAVAATPGTYYGIPMRVGRIYTVAGNGTPGFESVSSIEAAAGGYSGDNGPATRAQLSLATFGAVRSDLLGNILVADAVSNRVRVVAARTGTFYGRRMTAGDIYTIAGDGSGGITGIIDGVPATSAAVASPYGVAIGRDGSVLIAVAGQNRVRVVAERTGRLYGLGVRAGDIYTLAGNGELGNAAGPLGDGGLATMAEVSKPSGVAVDHHGNVLIADSWDAEVRVVAESTGTFYGQHMRSGYIYKLVGNFAGSSAAQLAVDRAGNLVIVNEGGEIDVVAARQGSFYHQRMLPGDRYPIAGVGPASLGFLTDVALDRNGNILFTDAKSCRVRVFAVSSGTFYGQNMLARHIYTIAGGPACGYSGDGGPAVKADLCGPSQTTGQGARGYVGGPSGVTVTPAGDVVIGDCLRLRRIAA